MTAAAQRQHPWRDGDVIKVSTFAFLGLATIVTAWFGASGSASITHQAAWLNLGIGGLVVFGAGNCLWLLAVRGAVGDRRASLVWLDSVAAEGATAGDGFVGGNGIGHLEPATTATWRLVRGAGMKRVHSPDCPLVAGKRVEPAGVSDGEPCGVCLS